MALVDWTEKAGLQQQLKAADADGRETAWALELSQSLIHSLSTELESVYGFSSQTSRDPELRLELPNGRRLFWKERAAGEGTRFLVAHPELRSLGSADGSWKVAAVSNLNLIFTRSTL